MVEKAIKALNFVSAPDRLARFHNLCEIRLNHLLFKRRPANGDVLTFEQFRTQLAYYDTALCDLLEQGGEAEKAVREISAHFECLAAKNHQLPFLQVYNADRSIALLCYSLTRHLRPDFVLETGVCYGISSALVLLAMERNNHGQLVSIDLPPLSDPCGSCTGIVIPEQLRKRWTLHLGSSRRWLPQVLKDMKSVGLFFADDANIYTLQRYEFEMAWPRLSSSGIALINNISGRFQRFLGSVDQAQCYYISQVEKPCVTALVFKKELL